MSKHFFLADLTFPDNLSASVSLTAFDYAHEMIDALEERIDGENRYMIVSDSAKYEAEFLSEIIALFPSRFLSVLCPDGLTKGVSRWYVGEVASCIVRGTWKAGWGLQ